MMARRNTLWVVTGFSFSALALATAGGAEKARVDLKDIRKMAIEAPTKTVLAAASAPAGDKFVNPKVAPGLVKWQPTFAAACEASRRSGKPVLLFQMMGKLDEQFC